MRVTPLIATMACTAPVIAQEAAQEVPVSTAAEAAPKAVVQGLDQYRVIDPLFEAVRIALAHRGETYSADYIQGVSGSAFRIAGICPCAPTCSNAMWPPRLLKLLGYDVTVISLDEAGVPWAKAEAFARMIKGDQLPPSDQVLDPDVKKLYASALKIIAAAKQQIRNGRPVLMWHAFTNAEYDIVAGYDDSTWQFIGRGSYAGDKGDYAKAGQGRTATAGLIGGWPAVMVIGEKKGQLDATAAEVGSIKEAIRHAHDQKNVDKTSSAKWEMFEGTAAYDRWAKDWENPEKKRGAGDSYCFGIYSSTHRSAAEFLKEIAPKYPRAKGILLAAAAEFTAEAKALEGGRNLLWWNAPEGPDASRNAAAAKVLHESCEHYKAGILHLEKALPLMTL